VAVAGGFRVTVALPLTLVNPAMVLVAVTVTVAGAGYGVVYRPLELSVPGFKLPHDGQVSDQVTPLL
jgi:hypothetical protein